MYVIRKQPQSIPHPPDPDSRAFCRSYLERHATLKIFAAIPGFCFTCRYRSMTLRNCKFERHIEKPACSSPWPARNQGPRYDLLCRDLRTRGKSGLVHIPEESYKPREKESELYHIHSGCNTVRLGLVETGWSILAIQPLASVSINGIRVT